MNRQLRRLALVTVLMLVVLVGATTYWQAWAAGGLQDRQDNAIERVIQFTIQRGLIVPESGKVTFAANRKVRVKGETFFFRRYPTLGLAAQTIGYSTASRSQAGLEQSMNDYLTGSNTNLSNAFQRQLDRLGGGTVKGNKLVLSLDPSAQALAMKQLGHNCGAVVAMNIKTGAVLVLASTPTYNPNLIDQPGGYAKVLKIRGGCGSASALLPRTTKGLYTPGSTFKMITAAAALDTGKFKPWSRFYDPGYCTEYGKPVSNAGNPDQGGTEVFGNVTLAQGFQHSINSVFCNVGKALGAKTVLDYAKRFGFYSTPPLETPADERAPSGLYITRNGGALQPERPEHRRRPGPARVRPGADAGDAAADGDGRRDDREQGRRAAAVRRPADRRARRLDRARHEVEQSRPRDQAEDRRRAERDDGLGRPGRHRHRRADPGRARRRKDRNGGDRDPQRLHGVVRLLRPRRQPALRRRGRSREAAERLRRGRFGPDRQGSAAEPPSWLSIPLPFTDPVASLDPLIGSFFDGRYKIVRKLGAGGMANVYLAEDQELGRRVAIKILNDRHANDDQFVERFRREAKNAAALSHPNIVSIYDRGEAEGTYYIAMEYLDGRSLKELIVTRGPAPVPVAVEYARQILSALRFAHRHGIVHRDIKPHNVLVDGEGRVKVTDFGIARAGASQMTEVGSIVGTAQYLSPEQARGTNVDQRSDLYSLGVVLYELLTGSAPFGGDTPVEIAMKHLSQVPEPPSAKRPNLPHDLDLLVMRALAKDPDERYQSAEEMDADLERVARGVSVSRETEESATQILSAQTGPMAATAATMIAPPPRAIAPAHASAGRPGLRRSTTTWTSRSTAARSGRGSRRSRSCSAPASAAGSCTSRSRRRSRRTRRSRSSTTST